MRLPAVLVPPLAALMVRAALRRWYASPDGRDEDTADLAALAVLLLPASAWNVLITTDAPLALFSLASLLVFARAAREGFRSPVPRCRISPRSRFPVQVSGRAAWPGLPALVHCFGKLQGDAARSSGRAAGRPAQPLLELRGLLVQRDVQRRQPPRRGGQRLVAGDAGALRRLACLPGGAAALVRMARPSALARRLAAARRTRAAACLAGSVRGICRAQPGQTRRAALAAVVPAGNRAEYRAGAGARRTALERALSRGAGGAAGGRDPDRRGAAGRCLAILALLRAAGLSRPHRRTCRGDCAAPGGNGARDRQLCLGGAARVPLARAGGGVRPGHIARAPGRYRYRLATIRGPGPAHPATASRRCPRTTRPIFARSRSSGSRWARGVYHAILGRGFNYQAYRAGMLADIRDRYYRIPPWLPAGRCFFFERYFPR